MFNQVLSSDPLIRTVIVMAVLVVGLLACVKKQPFRALAVQSYTVTVEANSAELMLVDASRHMATVDQRRIQKAITALKEFLGLVDTFAVQEDIDQTNISRMVVAYSKASSYYNQVYEALSVPDTWDKIPDHDRERLTTLHQEITDLDGRARGLYGNYLESLETQEMMYNIVSNSVKVIKIVIPLL